MRKQFISNVVNSLKLVKSISIYMRCGQKFSGYFEITSLINCDFKFLILVDLLRHGVQESASTFHIKMSFYFKL